MKVLVVNQLEDMELVPCLLIDTDFIPRVGDKIDMFYEPLPTVTSVVAWPSIKRLDALKIIRSNKYKIDAIITVN